VFTLKDKKPSENQYVQMLLLWLSHSIHANVLSEQDSLKLFIDSVTYTYLTTNTQFSLLLSKLPCTPAMFLFESPTTLLEGCSWKYLIDVDSYKQAIVMYCDIDIYLCKPLGLFCKSLESNTLYVHPEGPIHDPNYGAHFTKEELEKIPANSVGFSAGKFILTGKEVAKTFLHSVRWFLSKSLTTTYYCLEQPIFNYAIYRNPTIHVNISTLTPVISVNFKGYTKDNTVFLDCMGEPGNGSLHLEKFLQAMCLFHIGIL
jgi:hypothetical protein